MKYRINIGYYNSHADFNDENWEGGKFGRGYNN